jgi:anti-sigma regulatory factor (Ser/Thr protein kinase)
VGAARAIAEKGIAVSAHRPPGIDDARCGEPPSLRPQEGTAITAPHLIPFAHAYSEAPAVAITAPACSDEVARIRAAIGALGRRAGLDADRLADVALAVSEACANAVVHAYADREPGVLRATADITSNGLEIVIADEGRGMAPRPDSPGLGLGLPLMASLTSALEVRVAEGGGTEIWMVFATHEPAVGAAWAGSG